MSLHIGLLIYRDSNSLNTRYIYIASIHQMKFFLSYVRDCVYWYTSEAIGKWFVYTLGKILHVKLLGFAHWFMLIRISQLRDHYISVYQDGYDTSIVDKYLDTAAVNKINFCIRPLSHLI